MSNPTLAYWDLRGIAEPIRTMLKYLEINFEDRRYVCGDAPTFSKSPWTDISSNFGLAFPNLPYYIDNGVKLTESFAIMKYIARKSGDLIPTTNEEWARAEMLEGVVYDFRKSFTTICYSSDYANKRVEFFDKLPTKLNLFDSHLSKDKWLAGNNLTYVDFALAEILDVIRVNDAGCLDKHANVTNFMDNFFKLEKIAAYRNSGDFKRFPINNKRAAWGGNKE